MLFTPHTDTGDRGGPFRSGSVKIGERKGKLLLKTIHRRDVDSLRIQCLTSRANTSRWDATGVRGQGDSVTLPCEHSHYKPAGHFQDLMCAGGWCCPSRPPPCQKVLEWKPRGAESTSIQVEGARVFFASPRECQTV